MALVFPGTGADPGTTQISQIITPGVVVAAHVLAVTSNAEPFTLYATIGIGEVQPGALVNTKIQFAAGYISRHQTLSWTGFYPLEPNDHLYLTLTGDLTLVVEAGLRRLPNVTAQLFRELISAKERPA